MSDALKLMTVHNMLNPKTGKTWKEENLEKQHTIPIGTLVEVNISYSNSHGLRLFVGKHVRDCDGTPLYSLCMHDPINDHTAETLEELGVNEQVINLLFDGGYSDESLIVIRGPNKKEQ